MHTVMPTEPMATRRTHRIPATRASAVLAYGRHDVLRGVSLRLEEMPVTSHEEAFAALGAVDTFLAGLQERSSKAVDSAKRPETGPILEDLDLFQAIPGQVSHLPRAHLFLGFMDGASGARSALLIAKAMTDTGLDAYGQARVLIAGLQEESKTKWLAEWATVLRERPWLRAHARWPHVTLEDINTERPVFVVA
jgi:hypothetical protein